MIAAIIIMLIILAFFIAFAALSIISKYLVFIVLIGIGVALYKSHEEKHNLKK